MRRIDLSANPVIQKGRQLLINGGFALLGVGLLAGAAYGGYKFRESKEAEAYAENFPQSTKIGCGAPAVRRVVSESKVTSYILEAQLIPKAATSEKPIVVSVLNADDKFIIDQRNLKEIAAKNAASNLFSPADTTKPEFTPQILLTDKEAADTTSFTLVFTTSAGNIVRCAPASIVTEPVASPSLTPSSEITVKQ